MTIKDSLFTKFGSYTTIDGEKACAIKTVPCKIMFDQSDEWLDYKDNLFGFAENDEMRVLHEFDAMYFFVKDARFEWTFKYEFKGENIDYILTPEIIKDRIASLESSLCGFYGFRMSDFAYEQATAYIENLKKKLQAA